MVVLERSENERDQLKANYEVILKTLRDIKADLKTTLDAKDQTIDELRTRIEEQHVVMDSASEALMKMRDQIIEKDGELAAYKDILGLPGRA
jgi:chromosome condensin MukBEF ATPase and DNA-binding subunit MukB